jgi:hypothetical protein
MSSEKIFFTITSLYTVVLIMMHFTPEAIAAIGEMFVSTNRIEVQFVKMIHMFYFLVGSYSKLKVLIYFSGIFIA